MMNVFKYTILDRFRKYIVASSANTLGIMNRMGYWEKILSNAVVNLGSRKEKNIAIKKPRKRTTLLRTNFCNA